MPDLTTLKAFVDQGLGIASFCTLIVAIWMGANWGKTLFENHLAHIQDTLTQIVQILNDRLPPKQ